MSLRSGNNKKKGQKYQNTFAFKHNKNSMLTRKLLQSPLDFLCQHCVDILEWKLAYRKYKPLTTPSRCNICKEKTIFKAYRTICDPCAIKDNKKLCAKCCVEVEEYGKAKNGTSNPNGIKLKKKDALVTLIKGLKKKYQKTVYRKIKSGIRIEYDESKGIIDKETKEVIIPMENILDKDELDEFADKEDDIEDMKEEDLEKELEEDNDDDEGDGENDGDGDNDDDDNE